MPARRGNAKIPKISVEDVFQREIQILNDLRRDIFLLTIANTECKIGETHSSKSAMEDIMSSDERAKSTVLGHTSTLLGARHPESNGPSALDYNAVSGRIEPHGATIVCSFTEMNPSESAETVLRSAVVNADEGKRMLENWSTIEDPSKDQFVDVHVSQVASILAHAWRLDRSQRFQGDLCPRFQLFMIRRARFKIVARIDNLVNLWGGCPIEIMQDWYKTHPDVVQESTSVDAGETVQKAERTTEAENVEKAGQGGKSSENSIDQVAQSLRYLPISMTIRMTMMTSSHIEEDEDAVQHLFRSLQTIIAWNAAIGSLMNTKGVFSELNVFLLKNLPRIDLTLADIDEPISRYETLLREGLRANYEGAAYGERLGVITARMNDVKRRLRLNEKNVQQGEGTLKWVRDRCRVHAEAALMSLAWSYSEGATQVVDGVDFDTLFPQEGSVIIGSLEGRISFVLPGTHAVILPWLPPSGISESVLVKMRETLFGFLHARVCMPGFDHSSNPSSPVDDDSEVSIDGIYHSLVHLIKGDDSPSI
ncbi:hypothetical protein ACG7TL_001891 [Trametes sanguinea]